MNNESCRFELVEPKVSALIESLRAFGYELKTALADLIDNSITAKAKNIWLFFNWTGKSSLIAVLDDGNGMNERELVEAMRAGSASPLEERDINDLGRFGLGLKTASFSQCRRLSVTSKKDGNLSAGCWDLDYVSAANQWRLLRECNNYTDGLQRLKKMEHGTVVLWEKMDRVVANTNEISEIDHKHFLSKVADVRDHLQMVFHRYMETPYLLKIWINDRCLEPWDPFMKNHPTTQAKPVEKLNMDKVSCEVSGYILPHISKLSPEDHQKGAGINGWNAHQGFYVYRNRRMLVAGDWLGLGFQKEEHTKLARIQLDITNSQDDIWKIDVKKSKAQPPDCLRDDLRRIARLVRNDATKIYRHRGRVISRNAPGQNIFMWQEKVRHGKRFYLINREHPLVKNIIKCSGSLKPKLDAFIKLAEETFPAPLIIISNSENPDSLGHPFEGIPSNEIKLVLAQVWEVMSASGLSDEQIAARVLCMEPFDQFPEFVAGFVEGRKNAI